MMGCIGMGSYHSGRGSDDARRGMARTYRIQYPVPQVLVPTFQRTCHPSPAQAHHTVGICVARAHSGVENLRPESIGSTWSDLLPNERVIQSTLSLIRHRYRMENIPPLTTVPPGPNVINCRAGTLPFVPVADLEAILAGFESVVESLGLAP